MNIEIKLSFISLKYVLININRLEFLVFKTSNDSKHAMLDRSALKQSIKTSRSNINQNGLAKNHRHQCFIKNRPNRSIDQSSAYKNIIHPKKTINKTHTNTYNIYSFLYKYTYLKKINTINIINNAFILLLHYIFLFFFSLSCCLHLCVSHQIFLCK